ncbi:hypothetical protein, partial [Actinotalea ferrariae]|uniref:hypothetical protein n=1 Tax=Actinotalea ferrariae TaxID=1386098 RepID=UPI001C8B4513
MHARRTTPIIPTTTTSRTAGTTTTTPTSTADPTSDVAPPGLTRLGWDTGWSAALAARAGGPSRAVGRVSR